MHAITFLPTSDLESTDGFYAGALGLPLVLDQGVCRIYRVGAAFWGFCACDSPMAESKKVTLTLVDEDVDGWHERLVRHGVAVDGAPRANPRFRIYHFYVTDPNGYSVEVQRFLHPFP